VVVVFGYPAVVTARLSDRFRWNNQSKSGPAWTDEGATAMPKKQLNSEAAMKRCRSLTMYSVAGSGLSYQANSIRANATSFCLSSVWLPRQHSINHIAKVARTYMSCRSCGSCRSRQQDEDGAVKATFCALRILEHEQCCEKKTARTFLFKLQTDMRS
jgi:hypothetical protein